MTDQFAVIEATVPSSTGTQDYTSSDITSWRMAVIVWSGNYITENQGATMGLDFVTPDDGANSDSGYASGYFRQDRTTTTFCRGIAGVASDGSQVIRIYNPDSGGLGLWASAAFSADLGNGFRLNWTDVSGVSAGVRGFKMWIVLLGGTGSQRIGQNTSPTTLAEEPDMVLQCTATVAPGASINNYGGGFGACVNDGSQTQASMGWMWPGAADPVQCHNYVSSSRFCVNISAAGAASLQLISAFNSTGWTSTGGTVNRLYYAFNFDSPSTPRGVQSVSFSGSGTQTVGSLAFSPMVLMGFMMGTAALDTVANDAGGEVVGFFVADAMGHTYCVSMATKQGQTVDAVTPSVGFCRYTSGEVNLVSNSGGTAFRATSVTLMDGGLSWNVQTAMSGHILLIGLGEGNVMPTINEEEDISDAAVLVPGWFLVQGEEEDLSDACVRFTNNVTGSEGLLGWTYYPGAERGTTIYGHAEEGLTL